ncbi:hypothetical protein TCAL_16612 [Tigriopus californicus]|uniref:Homologous recombination OB-fold protein OB-fold domain-containing protein n=1 Tax=Tigriopus californicus TaxID=6832 RepID=A0A553NAQ1_TIGCA|nr:homologous recombination OB-fold protein-like [Tigriopus californicus]TRY62521.1 hypothetical protein TCAL_16612 [Tigriopus californicus]
MFGNDDDFPDFDLDSLEWNPSHPSNGVVASSHASTYVPNKPKCTNHSPNEVFRSVDLPQKRPSPSDDSKPELQWKRSRRKIPGPAGMLSAKVKHDLEAVQTQDQMASQTGTKVKIADSRVWRQMVQEHDLTPNNPKSLLNRYNIEWVKRKTCPGTGKKAPVLYCALKALDLTSMDPKIELEDPSGHVDGVIHRDVIDKFGPLIQIRSVLVLKNVHVIMNVLHHYVLITLNNLAHIYKPDGPSVISERILTLSQIDLERNARDLEEVEFKLVQKARVSTSEGPKHVMASIGGPGPQSCPRPNEAAKPKSSVNVASQFQFKAKLTANLKTSVASTSSPGNELLEGLDDDSLFGDF